MESTLAPIALGALLIGITVSWFSWMFWSGMHEDDTPRRPTRTLQPGDPAPWWTNDGFDNPAQPIRVPAESTGRTR